MQDTKDDGYKLDRRKHEQDDEMHTLEWKLQKLERTRDEDIFNMK